MSACRPFLGLVRWARLRPALRPATYRACLLFNVSRHHRSPPHADVSAFPGTPRLERAACYGIPAAPRTPSRQERALDPVWRPPAPDAGSFVPRVRSRPLPPRPAVPGGWVGGAPRRPRRAGREREPPPVLAVSVD